MKDKTIEHLLLIEKYNLVSNSANHSANFTAFLSKEDFDELNEAIKSTLMGFDEMPDEMFNQGYQYLGIIIMMSEGLSKGEIKMSINK